MVYRETYSNLMFETSDSLGHAFPSGRKGVKRSAILLTNVQHYIGNSLSEEAPKIHCCLIPAWDLDDL